MMKKIIAFIFILFFVFDVHAEYKRAGYEKIDGVIDAFDESGNKTIIGSNTQLRLSTGSGGAYLMGTGDQAAYSGGIYWNGSQWIPKSATTSVIFLDDGWIRFGTDSGLTPDVGISSPTWRFHISPTGGVSASWTIVSITNADSPYTALSTTEIIFANATAGAITINLPTTVGIAGKKYEIRKTDTSTNIVTIDANGSETIDNYPTAALAPIAGNYITLISNGSNWVSDQVGRWKTVYVKNTASAVTCSTGVEQTAVTFTLPANSMGANGILRILYSVTRTNNANLDDTKVRLNGTILEDVNISGYATKTTLFHISNRNNVSSQIGTVSANSTGLGAIAGAFLTATVNTAAATTVTINVICTTGDSWQVEAVVAEVNKQL